MADRVGVVVIPMDDLRTDILEYGIHCHNCSKRNGHFCNGTPHDCENAILIYLRDYVEWMQPRDMQMHEDKCECECENNEDLKVVKGFCEGE